MRFLREYDSAREEELRRLAERSIARLPSTLAKPIASLQREVEKENFSAGMNYALDFLEISVQYVGCCLFVLLQNAEAGLPENSRAMKAIVGKIDTKRSLSFGDWVNDIFNPAVRAAVKELPDNPLVKSLDRTLFSKGANRLLGTRTEPSVVRIRNEYKGHSTTLSNDSRMKSTGAWCSHWSPRCSLCWKPWSRFRTSASASKAGIACFTPPTGCRPTSTRSCSATKRATNTCSSR